MSKVITRSPSQVFDHWVKALRSGEYEQGHDQLKNGNTFCCLGVLCDLAVKDGGPKWGKIFSPRDGYVPYKMQEYLGISDNDNEKLVGYNDDKNYSFKKIASLIERNIAPRSLKYLEKSK